MRNLCNARVAEDISLHPKGDGELPLLPLPVISAPLQAMLRQQPDVALYEALELELPFLARCICREMQSQTQSTVV